MTGKINKLKMAFFLFPHFNRKITAPLGKIGKAVFFFFAFIVFCLNLFSQILFTLDQEKKLKLDILKNPFSAKPHENLAMFYLDKNRDFAEKEFMLADDLFNDKQILYQNNILGITASPWDKWLEINRREKEIKKEIELWKEINLILPDYTFPYLKIASLFFSLNEFDKGKIYLEKVLKEDPKNETALILAKEIKSSK